MAVQDKDKLVSLEDLKTAYDDLDGGISEVRNTLSHKADVIYDTASGDIASFPDGADGLPAKDLTVGIELVQDLHGYDNPWPAGGWKNLLLMTVDWIKANNGDATWNGNTGSKNGVSLTINTDTAGNVSSVTVNGTATDNTFWGCGLFDFEANVSYLVNGCADGATGGTWYVGINGGVSLYNHNDVTQIFETAVSSKYLIVVLSGKTISNKTFYPMIRLATDTDPTFAPYSNICPISGWTGANVSRTGKNLLDISHGTPTDKVYYQNGKIIVTGGTYSNFITPTIIVKQSGTISISTYVIVTSGTLNFAVSKNGTQIAEADITANEKKVVSIQANANDELVVKFRTPNNGNGEFTECQVEYGSATSYVPYTGTTIPIFWQSEAGTVYGGTLDLTNWVLTADRVKDSFAWGDSEGVPLGNYTRKTFNISHRSTGANIATNKISNIAPYLAAYSTDSLHFYIAGDTKQLFVFLPTGTSDDTQIDVVYPINDPVPYQLTPQEVEILTLYGTNNIWADCGPVSVDYPADTKMYVQKINAPSDDDMIADAQIASGKYFIVNNNLYISTTTILAGDPIKPGTNCTLTNLAAALNAINS